MLRNSRQEARDWGIVTDSKLPSSQEDMPARANSLLAMVRGVPRSLSPGAAAPQAIGDQEGHARVLR